MDINDDYRPYYSSSLGNIYFKGIKEDMEKFSEIAKELNTTPENVLLYIIAQKLEGLPDGFCDIVTNSIDDITSHIDSVGEDLSSAISSAEISITSSIDDITFN